MRTEAFDTTREKYKYLLDRYFEETNGKYSKVSAKVTLSFAQEKGPNVRSAGNQFHMILLRLRQFTQHPTEKSTYTWNFDAYQSVTDTLIDLVSAQMNIYNAITVIQKKQRALAKDLLELTTKKI